MGDYEVSYTARDIILYALSLGMGSHSDDANELRYLFEQHESFTAVPTFCFAFTFWANKIKERKLRINATSSTAVTTTTTTQGIPPFPPPIMAEAEVIPRRFLRNNTDISALPVIHTWQSIVWHRPLEIPSHRQQQKQPNPNHTVVMTNKIHSATIAVQPKSIGTFVTSQSEVTATATTHDNNHDRNHNRPLCTMQSTALIMGVDSDNVTAFDAGIPKLTRHKPKSKHLKQQQQQQQPTFRWKYQTPQSQALLYRMASGDSNHIHVDTSVSETLGTDAKAPILHGLFTLALAVRAILKHLDAVASSSSNEPTETNGSCCEVVFRKLEGAFKAPAFVGDCLCVRLWKNEDDDDHSTTTTTTTSLNDSRTQRFQFSIVNDATGVKLVDNGYAEIQTVPKQPSLANNNTRSRM